MEIHTIKTVKLKVPQLIEEFYYALNDERYEECGMFYESYNSFSDVIKLDTRSYVLNFLNKYKIDNKKDLNGLFNEMLGV